MDNKFEKDLSQTFFFDRRRLPPLAALSAFEAAARLGSFSEAARELCLTQGAISRQIKSFESFVGFEVFERTGQKIRITPVGNALAEQVRVKLAELVTVFSGAEELGQQEQRLTLGVLPSLASHWLIPRMHSFVDRHPALRLNILSTGREFEYEKTPFDAAIFVLESLPVGYLAEKLADETMVVVACPRWLDANGISRPEDLYLKNIMVQTNRQATFDSWLFVNDVRFPGSRKNPIFQFEHFTMMLEAAKAGMGAAVVPSLIAQDEVLQGRLRVIPGQPAQVSAGYYLVYQQAREAYAPLMAFRQWLFSPDGGALPAPASPSPPFSLGIASHFTTPQL